ncbi:MAG: MerC domain-containing protein [Acidobacteria bacterium]|nr:MAG: MerC domain-containing protein [Acidobacteriota bacterium]
MSWKCHLDKLGIIGSLVAAACCLGLPAVLAIFSAVGLGFLISDAFLRPLIIIFLAATIAGLVFEYRAHRRFGALALGVVSAVAVYFFIYGHYVKWAAYISMAGLVAAGVLNIILRRRCAPACDV